ncbi:MAG: protealysin inhibitor emfourin [Longimicrobiales bacterium]
MRINITRSGGFAGIEEQLGTIDTSTMQAGQANRLKSWVDDLERNAARAGDHAGADMYRYDVEVRDDAGRSRVFTILHSGDPAEPLPPHLDGLLHAL